MRVTIAQFPITNDISQNIEIIQSLTKLNRDSDVIVFAEGSVTGYDAENEDFIKNIDFNLIEEHHKKLSELSKENNIHIIVGSIKKEEENYYNTAYLFKPNNQTDTYKKINLAYLDKNHFKQGNQLPIFEINNTKIAIQVCREIMYPEQWRILAINGAKIIFHINNCIGKEKYNLWKSYLISRAAENQRYIFSVNTSSNDQGSPSIAIDPDGNVLEEINSNETIVRHIELDLKKPRDYYLNQRRTDVVDIISKNSTIKQD